MVKLFALHVAQTARLECKMALPNGPYTLHVAQTAHAWSAKQNGLQNGLYTLHST